MTPAAKQPALPSFENHDVEKATLRVVKAGDGLSQALEIAPKRYEIGDVVYLVMKGEISKVEFLRQNDSDELVRRHTLEASQAAEVAEGDIKAFLDGAQERIRKAKDDAAGQTNLLNPVEGASLEIVPDGDDE